MTEEREVEGGGQSSGLPAGDAIQGGVETLGRSGRRHWRESTITQPGLDDRGNVFFAAVEMTRMPMILTDPNLDDNPIVFANKAFLDLTGYEESEVLGRNCRFLQGAKTDRNQVAELREAIAAKASVSLEILNYRRDGSPFWNAVFIGPVYSTDGDLLYFFASQLDVSRRRESERAQQQAQKMEAIGQLTAGLAHDFNNLLQVVAGNLELLDARTDDDRARRYLTNARAAADRGAKLTRQLLAFARKSRLDPKPLDLSQTVYDFAEIIRSSVGGAIQLHLSLRTGLATALIDKGELEMALLNIVMNARDASSDGGLVTISTYALHLNGDAAARDLTPGDYVVVEVKDEGEGMPPEVVERAVEPFFTTKSVGKGTGLGLAMASGFLRQSRGRLELESKVGEGATIRMIFPADRDAAPAPDPAQTHSAGQDSSKPGIRILVVDDNDGVLELARDILTSAGYLVTPATSGDQAWRLFQDRQGGAEAFDLVFTDLIMPGEMDGLALAAAIGAGESPTPVLLTTGYNEELVQTGKPSGADIISKPYRRNELLDRVSQALARKGPQPPRRNASDFGAAEE